ncbi:MAG: hypothetical protein ACPGOV_08630 [Magnetovibrionaceae bacterium]
MAATAQQIVNEIAGHIRNCGGQYRDWYVGIAANPEDRLFSAHRVRKQGDAWIFRPAANENAARQIERHFINSLGTKGGGGGGTSATRFVYAYRIGHHTVE